MKLVSPYGHMGYGRICLGRGGTGAFVEDRCGEPTDEVKYGFFYGYYGDAEKGDGYIPYEYYGWVMSTESLGAGFGEPDEIETHYSAS